MLYRFKSRVEGSSGVTEPLENKKAMLLVPHPLCACETAKDSRYAKEDKEYNKYEKRLPANPRLPKTWNFRKTKFIRRGVQSTSFDSF